MSFRWATVDRFACGSLGNSIHYSANRHGQPEEVWQGPRLRSFRGRVRLVRRHLMCRRSRPASIYAIGPVSERVAGRLHVAPVVLEPTGLLCFSVVLMLECRNNTKTSPIGTRVNRSSTALRVTFFHDSKGKNSLIVAISTQRCESRFAAPEKISNTRSRSFFRLTHDKVGARS